jgi:hypothetical protein
MAAGLDSGGESGIRTRGGLLTPTRFPGVRLKPLIHLSEAHDSNRRFEDSLDQRCSDGK